MHRGCRENISFQPSSLSRSVFSPTWFPNSQGTSCPSNAVSPLLSFLSLCGHRTYRNPTSGCSCEGPCGLSCVWGGHADHSWTGQASPSQTSAFYNTLSSELLQPAELLLRPPVFLSLSGLPLCLTGWCNLYPPSLSPCFLSEGL